ncbi:MAG: hypothetical protein Q9165_007971 [Trypethelium subeluteriae]
MSFQTPRRPPKLPLRNSNRTFIETSLDEDDPKQSKMPPKQDNGPSRDLEKKPRDLEKLTGTNTLKVPNTPQTMEEPQEPQKTDEPNESQNMQELEPESRPGLSHALIGLLTTTVNIITTQRGHASVTAKITLTIISACGSFMLAMIILYKRLLDQLMTPRDKQLAHDGEPPKNA